ncbi:pyridoxal 5'-phosphate synthase lyase subunit PdxS [Candidatus Woesearchaeota archaeon]|nr:pyridoxal 5'-phosphate synthase lyase subunit PdxS [Candidatus Woesearchaeota archaeon]
MKKNTFLLKNGLAEMLKGGVIMDVVTAEQAKIAEKAGAAAVMALERVPADIRKTGGVARMADPLKIKEIMNVVSIPVMAKCRIGHIAEARVLEALGVDYIDESEVLTPADEKHVNKHDFKVPFVCGCRNLGEALRRINEGAAMIRTKGEAGTGNIIEAVRHIRAVKEETEALQSMNQKQLNEKSKEHKVPVELLIQAKNLKRLPVVNFAAGGVATPADAALMMLLGCDGIFVGSGIFKSQKPYEMAKAVVEATTNFNNPKLIAKVSEGLGDAMKGLDIKELDIRLQERGN